MAIYCVERSAKSLGVVANAAEPKATDSGCVKAIQRLLRFAGFMRVGPPRGIGIAPPSDGICGGSEESAGVEGVAVTPTWGRRLGSSDAADRLQE